MSDERAKVGRRAFLALGAGVIGGCVQDSAPGGRETTRPTTTQDGPTVTDNGETEETNRLETTTANRPKTEPTTTVRGSVTIGIGSDKNEPQARATIGGGTVGDEPPEDTIQVWNNADTARRITITIKEKGTAGEPLFRETYRFKPDAYVTIGISKPGKYAVSVAVDDGKPTTVGFTTDDCNYQSLYVTVMGNGTVRSSSISTMMACMTVSIPQTATTTADG